MSAHLGGNRKKGTGSIRKYRFGPGWEVFGPKPKNGEAKWLGHADTYREGEKRIERFLAESANDNATAKTG